MAVLVLNQGNVRNQAPAGRIAKFVADARDYMARRSVYRQTLRELKSLSGRELEDLGMHRSMITRIATEAAYGK